MESVYGRRDGTWSISDVDELSWFYWTAPFATESIRVFGTHPNPRDSHHVPVGGAMRLAFKELGFWRRTPTERPVAVAKAGSIWAEVLRRDMSNPRIIGSTAVETDARGVWYFAARGSGLWLDLGATFDHTCDHSLHCATVGCDRGAAAGGSSSTASSKGRCAVCSALHCASVNGSTNSFVRRSVNSSCELRHRGGSGVGGCDRGRDAISAAGRG